MSMTIAERLRAGKEMLAKSLGTDPRASIWTRLARDWAFWAVLGLVAAATFGLGLLVSRGMEDHSPENSLWIENLSAPQDAATKTSSSTVAPVAVPAVTLGAAAALSTPKSAPPVKIILAAPAALPLKSGEVVAAKTGKVYYLLSCGAAKRIKEENKTYFATRADADKAGLTPSKSCKGL
jgi:hypothetical protein